MTEMSEALEVAGRELESAVSRLDAGESGQAHVRGALTSAIGSLRAVCGEADRTADGSLELVKLETRATENLDLAEMSLDRAGGGSSRALASLQDALFHANRARDYLVSFLELLVERTRTVDRQRNENEFMAG
jgi:hypothetical protein